MLCMARNSAEQARSEAVKQLEAAVAQNSLDRTRLAVVVARSVGVDSSHSAVVLEFVVL